MDHVVGQRQVGHRLVVRVQAKVVVVVAAEALADASRVVQHRRYAVETEQGREKIYVLHVSRFPFFGIIQR